MQKEQQKTHDKLKYNKNYKVRRQHARVSVVGTSSPFVVGPNGEYLSRFDKDKLTIFS
jgi:hypothetical protein